MSGRGLSAGRRDEGGDERSSRWLVIALVGLLVWYAATFLFWAVRPLDDTVPTAAVDAPANFIAPSQTVPCDSPLSGSREPDGDLPDLEPFQGYERVYTRAACAKPVEAAQRLLLANTAVVVVGALALLYLLSRRRSAVAPAAPVAPAAGGAR
jgi:hypothetical protein